MVVKAKPVAKKIAPKPVKKAPAKPVVLSAKAKQPDAAVAEKKAGLAQLRQDRQVKRTEEMAAVVRLKSEGHKWAEIGKELGISQGKAALLFALAEGAEAGFKKATPALVVKERDGGKSWLEIMSTFNLSKPVAQKMYREGSGKDPSDTYIGKGGRYFSHEAAVAPLQAAKKAAAPVKKAPVKKVAAPKFVGKTFEPLFTDETPKEDIIGAIEGKMVVTNSGKFRVRAGTAKLGKEKASGIRIVQFRDAKTGGLRTVRVANISAITK